VVFKKETFLVCDDQPMLRHLLSNVIKEFNACYDVVAAENGVVAEQLLREQQFSAIFLDVEMPEQDGFTTLEKIRNEGLNQGAPVVMCTGCAEEQDLVRGWELEADFYLVKPFDLDELDSLLKEIAEKKITQMV